MKNKPKVFVASCSNSLNTARKLKEALRNKVEAATWDEGIFELSSTTIESLEDATREYQYAVVLLSADDIVESKGVVSSLPRDNLIFELGLFIGALSRQRTFFTKVGNGIKLPTDIDGVTYAKLNPANTENINKVAEKLSKKITTDWKVRKIETLFTKDGFRAVDIEDAPKLWEGFTGDYFAWNPSWQTELSRPDSEWMEMQKRRYTDSGFKRATYIIGFDGRITNDDSTKNYFYLRGFRNFLKRVKDDEDELWNLMEEKMDIYLVPNLPSDITFFIGKRSNEEFGLMFVNEAPLFSDYTPRYALVTNRTDMLNKMRVMVSEFTVNRESFKPSEILKVSNLAFLFESQ